VGTVRRDATRAEADALASAIRLRIIRLTYHRGLTNKDIADRLGKDPATTLHHVRKLVDTGFLEALPERRGNRGAKEIPYRSTGKSWTLSVTTDAEQQAMLQAYLGEIGDTGFAEVDQTRFVIQAGPETRAELVSRINALCEEYAQRQPEDGGERIAVYLALYPGE
jgi:DNA-binding transcriptional ArsR family regulator